MTVRILRGDCRDLLKTLPDNSVHCCVTSPPYWGLRSYLPADHPDKHREIGSEPTLQEWVDTMVAVFREVRRVLRPDGTLWLNLGDAYSGSGRGGNVGNDTSGLNGKQPDHSRVAVAARKAHEVSDAQRDHCPPQLGSRAASGLKDKDLMGQPWRVAFALQADGWWLRQEIIWAKNNPMPESAKDRFTKAHEQIFLLTKRERYYWNFEAVQEPVSPNTHARMAQNIENQKGGTRAHGGGRHNGPMKAFVRGTNRKDRGVGFGHGTDAEERQRGRVTRQPAPSGWDSSTGEGGHGAAHKDGREERPTSRASRNMGRAPGWRAASAITPKAEAGAEAGHAEGKAKRLAEAGVGGLVDTRNGRSVWNFPTEGFKGAHYATFPTELARRCIAAGCPIDGTVLDPFGGSGTVGLEADRQHKHAILIDLDERNVPMAAGRIRADASLLADIQETT